jgi:hypothetical protein
MLSFRHYYAVSNRHVTHRLGASIIRINIRDGKSRLIELAPNEWHYAREGDDLSVADITDRIDMELDEISAIDDHLFINSAKIADYEIDIGEVAFMIGLFVSHPGGTRNEMFRVRNLDLTTRE